ncbi:MAG: HAD family hydrolase [Clostridia bacterium]|nr:HAD family hydrolase [Clostridia bacterium]
METGRNAGVFTVGVSWGFRTKEELSENGADVIIDHPAQLLELL